MKPAVPAVTAVSPSNSLENSVFSYELPTLTAVTAGDTPKTRHDGIMELVIQKPLPALPTAPACPVMRSNRHARRHAAEPRGCGGINRFPRPSLKSKRSEPDSTFAKNIFDQL